MAGFRRGAGSGSRSRQWMIQGEPDGDVYALDVARFGAYATRPTWREKAGSFTRGASASPTQTSTGRPAGPRRRQRCTIGSRPARRVFGVSFGLEYPLYFACARGACAREARRLRRSNAFARVAAECGRRARQRARCLMRPRSAATRSAGPGAEAALDRVLAGKLPEPRADAPDADARAERASDGGSHHRAPRSRSFLVFGSGYLQGWHLRWFEEHLPKSGVRLTNLSNEWGGIAIFGPRSRERLRSSRPRT